MVFKVMGSNTKIVCMDSTHKTVKSLKPDPENDKRFTSAYLFTLLVKDVQTQLGVPVAFMVCNSESMQVPLFHTRNTRNTRNTISFIFLKDGTQWLWFISFAIDSLIFSSVFPGLSEMYSGPG